MPSDTKQRLLKAGSVLFANVGYQSATVGQIEEAAGLSPRAGGFYRHFKSKEALLLAIARTRFETPEQLGLVEVLPLADTKSELIYIARAYDRLNQNRDGLADLIRVEATRLPTLADMIRTANDALLESLSNWASSKPYLKNASPEKINAFTMMVFGAWLFYLARRDEVASLDPTRGETILQEWASFWSRTLDQYTVN